MQEIRELLKNFEKIQIDHVSSEKYGSNQNDYYYFWYKDLCGSLRVVHDGEYIFSATLDIPDKNIQTLDTNTKLEKLAKKFINIKF